MTTIAPEPDKLEKEVKKQLEKGKAVYRWLIIGGAGVGKSSFINKLVGREVCKVGVGFPVTQGFQQVKLSDSLVVYDSKGMEKGQTTAGFMKTLQQFLKAQKAKGEAIDALAVMVTNRIEQFELDVLNGVQPAEIPTVALLLHRADRMYQESKSIQAKIQRKEIKIPEHVRVFLTSTQDKQAEPTKCQKCNAASPSFAWSNLARVWKCEYCQAAALAPLCHQNDGLVEFISSSATDQQKRLALLSTIPVRGRGYKIAASVAAIAAGVAFNGGVAATPIPFSDWPLMVAGETVMITTLAVIWGANINKSQIGVFITAILGTVGLPALLGIGLGKGIAALLKFIPGVGSIAGGAIDVVVSGLITTLVGVVACVVLAGGDLTNEHLANKALADEAIRKRIPESLLTKIIAEVKKGRPVDEILDEVIPSSPK